MSVAVKPWDMVPDDPAESYDAVLADHAWRCIRPHILDGRRVCEVGVGRGYMTRLISEYVRATDGTLTIVDKDADAIAANARYALAGYTFDIESESDSLLDWGVYDHIILCRVLEHLSDPVAALRRLARWLAPSGQLHVVVPNAYSAHRRMGVAAGLLDGCHAMTERDFAAGHRRVYDGDTLADHIHAAGLVYQNAIEATSLKPLHNAAMAMLPNDVHEACYAARTLGGLHSGAELYARCVVR